MPIRLNILILSFVLFAVSTFRSIAFNHTGLNQDTHKISLDFIINDTINNSPGEPDTLRWKDNGSDRFFGTLKEQAGKKKWTQQLYNAIVIAPPRSAEKDSMVLERDALRFIQYEGFKINNIHLVKLDPFNTSIHDTIAQNDNLVTRTANNLHVKTNDRIILNQLLIKPGDIINSQLLADNERLLRELPFISDARIIVDESTVKQGLADITVITKDAWSKAFFVEFKDIDAGKLEIYDNNLFGSGFEIQNNIHWDPKKSDRWGYEAFYRNHNILGSFINSRVFYRNVFDTESYGYSFNRSFFTQDIKYAGGSSAYYLRTERNIWVPDSGFVLTDLNMNYFDIWTGRAFQLLRGQQQYSDNLNLILAMRYHRERYFDRPDVSPDRFHSYHDKKMWLNTIAISRQSYFKNSLIYNFGRTEDIPRGFLVNFTFGPEFGEFSNRFYTSLQLSGGNYFNNIGYLYSRMSYGGFHTREGKYEQGILDIRLNWFTDLFLAGGVSFRHFIRMNYVRGIDRFQDEKININEPYGLRGFSDRDIFGDQRLTLTLESNAFLPINLVGFQFVGFFFTDLAFMGEEKSRLVEKDLYTGIGAGLRIRNERLVFPTFQLRLAYYPHLPGMSPYELIRFLGEERFRPENFNVKAPSVADFQ